MGRRVYYDSAGNEIGLEEDAFRYMTVYRQTNADRIRSMADEELAKYLAWLEDEQACYQWEMYGDVDRITEWLDWLREEVAE